MIQSRQTGIDKYLYLSSLKNQNLDLFYRVLIDNVRELMPLVYTPTIGDVCLQYSTLYTRPEALYISIKQRKSIRTILRNWPYPDPEICVVTDGSRILGLGDLGVNGVGISVSSSLGSSPRPRDYWCSLLTCLLDRKVGSVYRCRRHPPRQDSANCPRLWYQQ